MQKTKKSWMNRQNQSQRKRFMVSIPDESVSMALSRELYKKHELSVRDCLQTVALEYAYNEKARPLIDRVIENRLEDSQYIDLIEPVPNHEMELVETYTPPQKAKINHLRKEFNKKRDELKQIDPNDPKHKQTRDKAITLLEKRIHAIWD